ncbi:MAG TPA: LamG domain-containing protein [Kiritimatiellia bacterium]|nr:LamG domain-containing protein [Kiritimatiellia bacterium]HRU69867.1 LamG domain-containing protein [Kiritimatiellia bacterium]
MRRIVWAMMLMAGMAMADMPDGLVLRFTCDELRNNGTLLPEATGSNSNGRATGVRYASGGRLNACCEFTGVKSSVLVTNSPMLESRQTTIGFWLKTNKTEWPERTLVEKHLETGYALRLVTGKEAANKGKLRATVAGKAILSDVAVADNNWHHVALSIDSANAVLYVDGVAQKQRIVPGGDFSTQGADLLLGASRVPADPKNREVTFEGMLDEVVIFKRALNEAEVKDAIAATKPRFTKQQVERRLRELQDLYDRGLLTQAFYESKVKECEVSP